MISNKPLMGCGQLSDWLRKKRCIYAMDKFDDNLEVSKRNCDAARNLARHYYGDKNLKKKEREAHRTC